MANTRNPNGDSSRWTIQAETLLEVAGLLNSTLERDQVLDTLARQFLRIVAADWVVVVKVAEPRDEGFTLVAGARQSRRELELPRGTVFPPGSNRCLEKAARVGVPVWVQDVGEELPELNLAEAMDASSILAVPLLFRNELLGVLSAGWTELVEGPSSREIRLIQGLANQAATAMENARLYAEAERRAAQVTALFEIGRDISAHLDLNEILTSIVQKAQGLLGSDAAFLALLTPDGREMEMTAWVGLRTEAMRHLRLRREQGLGGAVVTSGEPIIVADYPPLLNLKDPPVDAVQQEGLVFQIAVPLSSGSDLLGVLYIANHSPSPFHQEDAQLVMAFAKQATIAIQNARLYEEALAQREMAEADRRRLQVIIDSMPEGVMIAEGAEGRIAAANRAGSQLLGIHDLPAGLGLEEHPSAFGLLTPEGNSYPWDQLPLARAIRNGEVSLGIEVVIRRPDGSQIPVLTNSAPFRDPEGHVSGAVLVFQDISAAKEAEQLKDEFISLVSHELRTPLTSIKGAARTLLRHRFNLSEDMRLQLLRDVDEEADRLYRLVENLLDFSRAEAGVLKLATEPVHLGKLAERVVRDAEIRDEGLHRFHLDFSSGLPAAEADPLRVEQVLLNLLDNAVKYSPSGGDIQVMGRFSEAMVFVSVRDHGIGIPPQDRVRVFGRFERGDGTSSGRGRGVGLGLAICRRLVEAHGGRIWLEAAEGEGSAFTFTLPTVQEEWG